MQPKPIKNKRISLCFWRETSTRNRGGFKFPATVAGPRATQRVRWAETELCTCIYPEHCFSFQRSTFLAILSKGPETTSYCWAKRYVCSTVQPTVLGCGEKRPVLPLNQVVRTVLLQVLVEFERNAHLSTNLWKKEQKINQLKPVSSCVSEQVQKKKIPDSRCLADCLTPIPHRGVLFRTLRKGGFWVTSPIHPRPPPQRRFLTRGPPKTCPSLWLLYLPDASHPLTLCNIG